ncbi:MAG: hypothetical protein J6P62_05600 [Bacteroidales bacterium]|nr:hypothetical protein [Bacteroidales bacterium]
MRDLVNDYVGAALTPEDLRALALIQVKDASLQDDAVQRAVANAQGVEQRNRSALEEYLVAAEQQAAAESQRALEMAQQRLNAIDNNMALISTTVGVGKEGKQKLKSLEAERQAILEAFPQLGKAPEGGNGQETGNPEEFDIKKWLAAKDYSPEAIRRLYEENDRDAWDEAIRTGDLKLFNAMNDFRLGSLSDDTKNKMRYVISQRPDLSKELKLNKEYSGLLDLIPSTQGDIIDAEKKAKAAATKKKEEAETNEQLTQYTEVLNSFMLAGDKRKRRRFPSEHPGFFEMMAALKKAHKLPAEAEKKVKAVMKNKE